MALNIAWHYLIAILSNLRPVVALFAIGSFYQSDEDHISQLGARQFIVTISNFINILDDVILFSSPVSATIRKTLGDFYEFLLQLPHLFTFYKVLLYLLLLLNPGNIAKYLDNFVPVGMIVIISQFSRRK